MSAQKLWHQLFHHDEQRHIDWRVRSHAIYEPEPEAWIGMLARQLQGRKPAPVQRQQTGGITPIPPTPRDTDAQAQLPPLHNPLYDSRALAELETVKPLPGLPRWLVDQLPQGLPTQRNPEIEYTGTLPELPPDIAAQLPTMRQYTDNDRHLDEMLETMHVKSAPLPPVFSKPFGIDDLPTEPRKPEEFAEHGWINGALPPLADLPSGELAVADKVNRFEVREEDCADNGDGPPTELHERTVARIREQSFEQAINGLREKKGSE